MKRIGALLLVLGLAALGARAQKITGSGTTNTIPQFTSSTSIGDSPLLQFNGNIGINSANPAAKFEVKDFRDVETPYSTLVAGIYSTQPGVVASALSCGMRSLRPKLSLFVSSTCRLFAPSKKVKPFGIKRVRPLLQNTRVGGSIMIS